MRQVIVGVMAALVWLVGLGFVGMALGSETSEDNWPIVFAVLGIGALLYALLWSSLEAAERQRQKRHEDIVASLVVIHKILNELRVNK